MSVVLLGSAVSGVPSDTSDTSWGNGSRAAVSGASSAYCGWAWCSAPAWCPGARTSEGRQACTAPPSVCVITRVPQTESQHCRAEMSARRVGHAHRGSETHDDGMVVYFCCAQRLIVSNQFCRSVRTCLRSVFVQLVSRCIEASDGCTWRALQAESRSAP